MRRMHLVELEDLPWWPRTLRDAATDYLQYSLRLTRPYDVILPHLADALRHDGSADLLDLCSGGAGPWPTLLPGLQSRGIAPNVHLSDKYPNIPAFEAARREAGSKLDYIADPVDATAVPESLGGFRTIFTALHHFEPSAARAILADAVRRGRGIAAFEATSRSPAAILSMFLTPFIVLLVVPALRPFRWSRIFWTYIIPLLPLMILFDGVVSCLRTYSPEELRELADGLGDGAYDWSIGAERVKRSPVPVTYIIGVRRSGPV